MVAGTTIEKWSPIHRWRLWSRNFTLLEESHKRPRRWIDGAWLTVDLYAGTPAHWRRCWRIWGGTLVDPMEFVERIWCAPNPFLNEVNVEALPMAAR